MSSIYDVNNILPLVAETLRQQNEKGLKKYGTALKDNDLTVLELLDHSIEEKVDDLQYTIIARERVIELEARWEKLRERLERESKEAFGEGYTIDWQIYESLIEVMDELERGGE